eukprot:1190645-Prorocentrum_minimum.AAC.1
MQSAVQVAVLSDGHLLKAAARTNRVRAGGICHTRGPITRRVRAGTAALRATLRALGAPTRA